MRQIGLGARVTQRYVFMIEFFFFIPQSKETRGVRLFWTPAPVLTNQAPDPTPGQ